MKSILFRKVSSDTDHIVADVQPYTVTELYLIEVRICLLVNHSRKYPHSTETQRWQIQWCEGWPWHQSNLFVYFLLCLLAKEIHSWKLVCSFWGCQCHRTDKNLMKLFSTWDKPIDRKWNRHQFSTHAHGIELKGYVSEQNKLYQNHALNENRILFDSVRFTNTFFHSIAIRTSTSLSDWSILSTTLARFRHVHSSKHWSGLT